MVRFSSKRTYPYKSLAKLCIVYIPHVLACGDFHGMGYLQVDIVLCVVCGMYCVFVSVCVCVCVWGGGSIAEWPGAPCLIPSWATWCCCCFLEQGTLLTLLQSIQLLKWEPGSLVPTGEAAHPAVTSMGTWGSKCSTVHVS